jgi:polyhydroxyalkanoate synthesis regulator phasin
MLDTIRKAALAGIGAITLTEERARKLVDELIEQGRVSREEGEALVKDMAAKTESAREEWEGRIRDMVHEVFRKMDLVPRKDLELVEAHLRKLEKRVAALERQEHDREEEVPVVE